MKQLSYFNFNFDFDFDFVLASVLLLLSEYYLFLYIYPPMCPALLHLITVPRSPTYLSKYPLPYLMHIVAKREGRVIVVLLVQRP